MSFSGQIAIAGVHEYESRWAPDKTALQITAECTREALKDAGLQLSDIDGLFGTTLSMGPMGIIQLAEYLNIKPRYLEGAHMGGASFLSHVAHAAAAIHSGLCDTALILYGSTAASDAMSIGTGDSGSGDTSAAFVSPYGVPLVASYAMVAQRHMHEYGTTPEQLADIAVSTRYHASLNPDAKMQHPITREDVLESRLIADPLRLLDCCIISDGGGAVIVTSLERARDLQQPPVVVLGTGEAVCHQERGAPDLLTIAAQQSGAHAFKMAGLSPADIHFATIYDSFTITVLLSLEALGFCAPGEGGAFVEDGGIQLGGRLPVNPDGGGLSSNHSGMRGIFLIIEAVRQLRGGLENRQVDNAEIALAHGTGGYLGQMHSGATLILAKDRSA